MAVGTRKTGLKTSAVVLLSLLIVVLVAEPVYAWHRVSGGIYIGVGPYWWGPPYPYWWGPPAYGYIPPPVVFEPPAVYIERPPPVPPPPPISYWYYCGSARSYYPSVETCPEPWVRVPARPR
jgi:hypothetical protein